MHIRHSKKTRKTNKQQPENFETRNDPYLVQAFLKKWWVESDLNVNFE
jgi:hypothetical protein